MGRRKEHDERTRAALLTAAERLIEQHGADAASVRAVADAIGTTTRAVYSVFGSKNGLLAALATRLFEMLSDAIDDSGSTDDPVVDVINASVRGFRQTALDHPALYGLVFLRIVPDLPLGAEFDEVAAGAWARLRAHIERIAERGELGAISVDDATRSVHALTEGLATMELRGMLDSSGDPEQIWRQSVGALLHGFAMKPR
jgi:AcrR family transcriptional regulator